MIQSDLIPEDMPESYELEFYVTIQSPIREQTLLFFAIIENPLQNCVGWVYLYKENTEDVVCICNQLLCESNIEHLWNYHD